eukprot:CAMPEP_0204525708 /NCGR_PEP_ID=MMETSP0661-20131031/8048_1 /ASSEMBLY_ACC=CAM_ASM_000606 /TAXON_ID=109239 /ORGANISM="Alexandrium margalefi, Strain AMGDE01CS-322" /LENGTH=118 /DNA_ID=CAMNT_0051531513 /DNA_START=9 /DNA_END=361 /DNA_ORIENTATION=-
MLSPELAKTVALQTGSSAQAVLSPDGKPGNVGFFSGSYVAPWAPSNRRPYTGGASTIISAVIDCGEPRATLAMFTADPMHRAIEKTIQSTISGSSALSGAPKVLGVSVVPMSAGAAPA